MKCPKCEYENPSGVRYCVKCGSQMLPPIPPANRKNSRSRSKRRINTHRVLIAALSIFMAVGVGILALFLFLPGRNTSQSTQTAVVPALPEENADVIDEADLEENTAEAPANDLPGRDSSDFSRYVNLNTRTVKIPESELTLTFPEYTDYLFDYDQNNGQMIFEIHTADNMIVTITSSRLNALPFTKSEAETADSPTIYHTIQGEETEYYYILQPNSSTVTGTIIDCDNNRSTSVNVVSQSLNSTMDSDSSQENKSGTKAYEGDLTTSGSEVYAGGGSGLSDDSQTEDHEYAADSESAPLTNDEAGVIIESSPDSESSSTENADQEPSSSLGLPRRPLSNAASMKVLEDLLASSGIHN